MSRDLAPCLAECPIPCHEIDGSGAVVAVNKAECRLLGLTCNEIVGRPVWEFVVSDQREISREAVFRKLSGTQPLRPFERSYTRPDGARFVLEMHETYLLDERGSIQGIRTFMLDMTGRCDAAEALQRSEERYRRFVEHASDIIYETDINGRFRVFNPTATRLLGYSTEELTGRKYLDLIRPDHQSRVRRFYRRQITAGVPHTYLEFPALKQNGEEIWFGQNVELIQQNGRAVGFQAITRDITHARQAREEQEHAREELEKRVKERTEQLERAHAVVRREMEERRQEEERRRRLEGQMQHTQRLESLGVLAGGIAHDFNNLLAGVLGYADLAREGIAEDSPARSNIEEVISAAKAAAELTQQMLAYSGRGRFVLESVNLSRLIEEVTRLLGTVISKKARLDLRLSRDLPLVRGDAAQLRQVLFNLLTNASDAIGDRAGLIQVTTGAIVAGAGELRALEPHNVLPGGTYVYVEVLDSGCGIDSETQAKIFEPFFTTKFTGRGLGLAAVLGILRGHHGSFDLQSEPGHGTRFRVFFPQALDAAPEQPRTRAGDRHWRGEGLVLVVDDEKAIRDLARLVLEKAGCTVITASDGAQALRLFEENADRISAVLLDLTMPVMGGGEVFERLLRIRPEIKVIACSGYDVQDVSASFGGMQPAAVLRKPFLTGDLLDAVRSVLR